MTPNDAPDDSPIEATLAPTTTSNSTSGTSTDRMIQSRGAVLAILFLVMGALGIPLLWMNKAFSNAERWFWAVVVTLYTALLIYVAWRICMWSYHQIFG
ncbi:hypothetical protein [Novipirellula caenicola]|uniref:Uncharacterized protein n=1 Tax=Novipirellula caenicola TaxID=1536901 RepID=A0ABP9VJC0_9BACT